MSQPSLCEVRVRGGLLPVWTQAGGPTALVFLHYWGGSRRTFAPVIASLSSRCTVVVYDQRGWGAARDLPGPYGINQLAATERRPSRSNPTGQIHGWKTILNALTVHYGDRIEAASCP